MSVDERCTDARLQPRFSLTDAIEWHNVQMNKCTNIMAATARDKRRVGCVALRKARCTPKTSRSESLCCATIAVCANIRLCLFTLGVFIKGSFCSPFVSIINNADFKSWSHSLDGRRVSLRRHVNRTGKQKWPSYGTFHLNAFRLGNKYEWLRDLPQLALASAFFRTLCNGQVLLPISFPVQCRSFSLWSKRINEARF